MLYLWLSREPGDARQDYGLSERGRERRDVSSLVHQMRSREHTSCILAGDER
jgi:hypothetical protein